MKLIKELFEYREMIVSLVRRELRGRYKGSVLGFFWTFLNPLLQLVVYSIVFSTIMRVDVDKYYLFLFVALIPWIFFSTSLTGGASCLIAQKDMIKKVYFPREVIPVSFVTSCFVNMLLCFVVIFLVIIFSGIGVNFAALCCLPIIMAIEYVLALGIAMISSAVTVYLRDFEHILGIIQMAWMYLSPVMYTADMVPDKFRFVMKINPMWHVIIAYRDILYYKRIPDITTLLLAFVSGIVILILGFFVFSKLKKHFAEEM